MGQLCKSFTKFGTITIFTKFWTFVKKTGFFVAQICILYKHQLYLQKSLTFQEVYYDC